MKAFFALLLLGGCATAIAATPAQRVAGCWIDRAGAQTTTMRWFAAPDQPGALSGALLRYGQGDTPEGVAYTLAPQADGWALCRAGETPTCWSVAQGRSGTLDGGRAFIDRHGERLRISVIDGSGEWEVFDGARDGCD